MAVDSNNIHQAGNRVDDWHDTLLATQELRDKCQQNAPLVMETVLDGIWYLRPTPLELGADPTIRNELPCKRQSEGTPCDFYRVFEPSTEVDLGICATHRAAEGRAAQKAWTAAIIQYIQLCSQRLEWQSLRMARFVGGTEKLRFPDASRFIGCDLLGTDFVDCILRGVTFEGKTRLISTLFQDCEMPGALFCTDAPIERVEFRRCNLAYSVFKGMTCDEWGFLGTDMRKTQVQDVKVTSWRAKDVDFSNSSLEGVTLEGLRLIGGSFNNVRLKQTKILSCHIDSVDFSHVEFPDDLIMSKTQLKNCIFSPRARARLISAVARGDLTLMNPNWNERPVADLPDPPDLDRGVDPLLAEAELRELKGSMQDLHKQIRLHELARQQRNHTENGTIHLVSGLSSALSIAFLTGLGLEVLEFPYSWPLGVAAGLGICGVPAYLCLRGRESKSPLSVTSE